MPSTSATFTVPELAARWRVARHKIVALIRAGELTGFDVSLAGRGVGTKARWRVTADSVEAFELRRAGKATPRPPRRTREPAGVMFYPER